MSRAASFIGIAVLAVGSGLAPVAADDPPVAFEPIQPELFAAGANLVNAFADLEGDGDPDLFVGFDGAPNRLYRNDRGRVHRHRGRGRRRRRPGDPRVGVRRLRRRRRSRSAARLHARAGGPGAAAVSQRRRPVHRSDGGRRAWSWPPARCGSRRGSTPTATATSISSSASAIGPTRSFATTAAASPTSRRRSASPIRARPSARCGSTPTRTATSMWPSPTWTATPTASS